MIIINPLQKIKKLSFFLVSSQFIFLCPDSTKTKQSQANTKQTNKTVFQEKHTLNPRLDSRASSESNVASPNVKVKLGFSLT